ncbi:hypothetical protein DFH07DRAFT_1065248 [Mycena maculata]|uniref:BTB domain-containing protein n=1 Tax=Mycena maculata TaxID=230809 RepID=A0AAD7MVW9_9AGAR|nr:hypothetical protein DFH07DRAFT_1065248 [Mycena maculata]
MSDTASSAKRKRMDLDPAETLTPTRSKIWMPYGDIILQAESTQFRVNRDVLAQQSSVFKDMFSIPQPPNELTVEGCPIVHMLDTAKDWELLLGVLYDPFQHKDALPFDVLASMLRLMKYEITIAVENATQRIHHEFPEQLDDWDGCESDLTKIEPREEVVADLLNLVYECGITTSIPTVAFCCLRGKLKLEGLLKGLQRPDKSRIILPDEIKQTMAIATERIIDSQHRIFGWLDNDRVIPHVFCTTPSHCTQSLRTMRRAIVLDENDKARYFGLDLWDDEWSDGMCSACGEATKEAFATSHKQFWESLPSFFGFPEWKDLRDVN